MSKKLIGIPFTVDLKKADLAANHPIKGDPTLEQFIMEKSVAMVKRKLQEKLTKMFSTTKPVTIEKDGIDLYISDVIYDVWPEDEKRGKTGEQVFHIVQGKIRDYLRIHSDYEYKNSEWNYFPGGQLRMVFHFHTHQLQPWTL